MPAVAVFRMGWGKGKAGLSREGHWLLFQRTPVKSPAPTLSVTTVPGDLVPLLASSGTAHSTQKYADKIAMHKIKINKSKQRES